MYLQLAGWISLIIFGLIIIFQLLITFGLPLGAYTMGGVHKGVLPIKWRIISFISIFVLLFFIASIFIQAKFLLEFTLFSPGVNSTIVWGITIYLGLNTIGNFFSKSKKEKLVMTPLSLIVFLACLYIAIYSN